MDSLITSWHNFLLVSLRVGCLLLFLPPWDNRLLPGTVKVFFTLGFSLAVTPLVAPHLPPFPTTWIAGLYLILREILWGLSVGLLFRFLFAGIQMAGNLVSIQMGFGMATLLDPQSQAQNTLLGEILVLLALMVFLTIDGHHVLLRFLVQSFEELPLDSNLTFPRVLGGYLSSMGNLMFSLGIQLLAPVLALLWLTQLALGLMARAVPQIHVLVVGFPLTIAVGLFFLTLTFMVLGPALVDQFAALRIPLHRVLESWKG
jgi:flagellar biosynthetic protein FliR|uniref:Flagellar biosynthetic protein FliR n=1 Tax=Desulfobacca acetoxidans TaxID=60893 RepID=A0A7C5EPW5_9BACT